MIHSKNIALLALAFTTIISAGSCRKDKYEGKDPYAGAKEQLDLKLNTTALAVGLQKPGGTVTLTGTGFKKYTDSGMIVKFNDVPGQIIAVNENSIEVKIPASASSGLITLTVKRQVFAGPSLRVLGALYIDSAFHSLPGANDNINTVAYVPGNKYLIGGRFKEYDNSGMKYGYWGLARLNPNGSVDRSFNIGLGVSGAVNAIVVQSDGKYMVGGTINAYNTHMLSNIARINPDGSMDSVEVTRASSKKEIIPALNIYFDGEVTHLLQTQDSGKVIVMGNFRYLIRKDFTISSVDNLRDSVRLDSVRMDGLARLHEDGTFDSSFNFNAATRTGFGGANGFLREAVLTEDGRLVIGGNFTRFNNVAASRIVRLLKDGSVDPAFSPVIDNNVNALVVLPGNKLLAGGLFSAVNGNAARKLVILNDAGAVDPSFTVGTGVTDGPNGSVENAVRLNNGKILLTGSFELFSGVKRKGLVVLEENGQVSDTYNSLGAVRGVSKVLHVQNANAVMMVGGFKQIDLISAGSIIKLQY